MRAKSVLVSGAGIAGSTVAYWLLRHGFEPVLVERAPAFRAGGCLINFWGPGYEVADRMGLLPRLRAEGYLLREVRLVDRNGRRTGGFGADEMRDALGETYLSIPRGDLARCVYESIDGQVETIYGDSVAAIEQTDAAVRVAFERGPPREFDLLIGADGVHSNVRRLAFGGGARERDLGYYAASLLVENYPRHDDAAVLYAMPGKQVARYALRDDRTVFFFLLAAPVPVAAPDRDLKRCKQVLRDAFAGEGWECAEIVAALDRCSDFYFDRVSQVRLDRWSRGRVALIGDAAFCPSLVSGEGASSAMTAAYMLAGELRHAGGDHRVAFRRYESTFRPFIEGKQRSAQHFAAWFTPRTRFGIRVRDATTRVVPVSALSKWFMRGLSFGRMTLPDYAATAVP